MLLRRSSPRRNRFGPPSRSRKHRWVSSSESQPSPSSPFSRPAPSSIRRSTGPPARQICFYSAACTSSGVRDDVRSPAFISREVLWLNPAAPRSSPDAQPAPPPAPIGVSGRSESPALPRKEERVLARFLLTPTPRSGRAAPVRDERISRERSSRPPRSGRAQRRQSRRQPSSRPSCALPRKGTPARTDADDCFDDSRHLRRTLASNGKKAPAVEESLRRASRVARRALSGKALVRIPSPPGRCPLAPPPKRKCQLPTAPPLMLCLGLRARASRVFALSRWTTTDSAGPDCWILAMRKYARWPGLPTTAEHTLATGSRSQVVCCGVTRGARRWGWRLTPSGACSPPLFGGCVAWSGHLVSRLV